MHDRAASTLFLEHPSQPPIDLQNNVVYMGPAKPTESDYNELFMPTEMMEDDYRVWSRRVAAFSREVAEGRLPEIGNGFQFVIDYWHEQGPIPADEYTRYFSRGEIPLAAVGHKEHEHDMGHGPNYQTLFRIAPFANCVRTAATNAVQSEASCTGFTNGMDGLGDNMRNLESGDYQKNHLLGAEYHLNLLVGLETTDPDIAVQTAVRVARFNELWQVLGLPTYEMRVATEIAQRPSIDRLIRIVNIIEL